MKSAKVVLLADTLVALYRQMLRIRRCEERLIRSFHEGLIPGPYSSSLGQEAVYVGVCHHLKKEDVVFGTHRGQGQALAKGMDMTSLIAELYGRVAGCCQGRGGPFALASPQQGILGSSGIAGSALLPSAGAAYAFQLQRTAQVSVAFFGEGGASSGVFHEALNLAGLWKLPVLFICEKNHFVGRLPNDLAVPNLRISLRGKMYEIPGVTVDGNDVAAVYAAAYEGILRAREGKGATLLECVTRRVRPHAEGDVPAEPPAESTLESLKQHDPLKILGERLVGDDSCTEEELKQFDREIRDEVAQAHDRAMASEFAAARNPPASPKVAGPKAPIVLPPPAT